MLSRTGLHGSLLYSSLVDFSLLLLFVSEWVSVNIFGSEIFWGGGWKGYLSFFNKKGKYPTVKFGTVMIFFFLLGRVDFLLF